MKEALKLALELKNSASAYWTEKEISIIEKLIDALAQPEQSVAGYCKKIEELIVERDHFKALTPPLPMQPVQEPVATMKMLHTYGDTTPPQRPWVGLTAQEAADCWTTSATKTWHNSEAALRSKNT